MLVMGHPQFEAQDDTGTGSGIPPIPEWLSTPPNPLLDSSSGLPGNLDCNREPANTLLRLRGVFRRAAQTPLTGTRLHDLTCFVIHRLLLTSSEADEDMSDPLPEAIRYGIILFMFMLQGHTYFSHAVIFNRILDRFTGHLKQLNPASVHGSLCLWLVAVGMAASPGSPLYPWIRNMANNTAVSLRLNAWEDVLGHLQSMLWLHTPQNESLYQPHWDALFQGTSPKNPPDPVVHLPPSPASSVYT